MFSVTKRVVAEFDKLYAIAGIIERGHFKTCYAASEGRGGRCEEVDLTNGSAALVWDGPGGTMTLCPMVNEGELLATQRFWPVFNAAESVLVRAHKEENGYVTEPVQIIPYLHRFELLKRSGGNLLLASTLCGGKNGKDDWSRPGAVYAGSLKKNTVETVRLEPVLTGLTKNHGFCVTVIQGKDAVLASASEGVFALYPSLEEGEKWEIKKLLDREASDAACYDLDGDGEDELVIIEGFHGNLVTVNQWVNGNLQPVWSTPVAFGHALWCGEIAGRRCLITGGRREEMELSLFDFTEDFKNPEKLVIGNGGSSQICVCPNENGAEILSADRERGQAVLYTLTRESKGG